jgi:hypothetical protein
MWWGRVNEVVKEGEYVLGTFSRCINIEHWKISTSFEEYWGTKINGGDEPNQGSTYVYVEMPQRNSMCNYHMLIKQINNASLVLEHESANIFWLYFYSLLKAEKLIVDLMSEEGLLPGHIWSDF